jgi:hypothetical protein
MNRNTLRRRLEWEDGKRIAVVEYDDGTRGELHAMIDAVVDQIKRFEYVTVGSSTEIQYIGAADQGTLTSDPDWIVKKFSYVTLGGTNYLEEIQQISNVAWDDRATLSWT